MESVLPAERFFSPPYFVTLGLLGFDQPLQGIVIAADVRPPEFAGSQPGFSGYFGRGIPSRAGGDACQQVPGKAIDAPASRDPSPLA
jgi:hypothetical protein